MIGPKCDMPLTSSAFQQGLHRGAGRRGCIIGVAQGLGLGGLYHDEGLHRSMGAIDLCRVSGETEFMT